VPLRDDLLQPIPGEYPAGVSLRYERIYDQIREARTEDDDSIPSGAWERAPKKADFALVIKLAGEALATRSKDLQLAAWLAESHVRREGIGLIQPCLKLMLDLQERFWDTLYPVIEDGDAGMRAVPIEWAANRIAAILRESPITRNGLSYFRYKESRAVGYEADAGSSDAKREARQQAISDGKVTAEEFDSAFAATPKSFYANLEESILSSFETLETLQSYCEEKYGDDAPAFGKLRAALEEVGQVIGSLLNEKRKLEPDAVTEEEPAAEPEPEAEAAPAEEEPAVAEAPRPGRPKAAKTLSTEPADREDAVLRVQSAAKFLQREQPQSPVAYLMNAALRLGEMREQGSWASYDFLVPPATETRQTLKRLAAESNWEELLSAAIAAAGEPCGRAWLDVHRYIWKASNENGYSAVAAAAISTVQALLKDIPELPSWTLSDDTPAANPETQRWLEENVIPKAPAPQAHEAQPEPLYTPTPEAQAADGAPPDVLEMARDFIQRGQLPQAIQLLMRDAAQQSSGRARFQRRLQIAQLCMSAGQGKVAYPVLEELVKEIEERRLEEWEDSEVISPPLALLLRCLESGDNNGAREVLFAKLCRIDPLAAMNFSR